MGNICCGNKSVAANGPVILGNTKLVSDTVSGKKSLKQYGDDLRSTSDIEEVKAAVQGLSAAEKARLVSALSKPDLDTCDAPVHTQADGPAALQKYLQDLNTAAAYEVSVALESVAFVERAKLLDALKMPLAMESHEASLDRADAAQLQSASPDGTDAGKIVAVDGLNSSDDVALNSSMPAMNPRIANSTQQKPLLGCCCPSTDANTELIA